MNYECCRMNAEGGGRAEREAVPLPAPTIKGGTPVPCGMGVPPLSEGTNAKTKDGGEPFAGAFPACPLRPVAPLSGDRLPPHASSPPFSFRRTAWAAGRDRFLAGGKPAGPGRRGGAGHGQGGSGAHHRILCGLRELQRGNLNAAGAVLRPATGGRGAGAMDRGRRRQRPLFSGGLRARRHQLG